MFKKHKLAFLGLIIIAIMVVCALFAGLLSPYDPHDIQLQYSLEKESLVHPFGRDENGADMLSKVIHASRISLAVGFSVVFFTSLLGILLGLLGGYYGGIFDHILMRIVDIFMAFPGLLLAITISALLPPSMYNVIFALSIVGWVSYARLVRGQVLSIKEREHVIAAKSLGASDARIIFIHILPNTLAPVLVAATFGVAGAIIGESSLSFLGIGVPPTSFSWGSMLDAGRQHLLDAPHLAIYPGIAIMLAVMGFNFLGDALRDKFDPKSRGFE